MRGEKSQSSGMSKSAMRRGNKRHYRELGKLGLGVAKTFSDETAAKEQRRLAGIASGKARAKKMNLQLAKDNEQIIAIALQVRRLNESAKGLSETGIQ